jgi:hypothetical protein
MSEKLRDDVDELIREEAERIAREEADGLLTPEQEARKLEARRILKTNARWIRFKKDEGLMRNHARNKDKKNLMKTFRGSHVTSSLSIDQMKMKEADEIQLQVDLDAISRGALLRLYELRDDPSKWEWIIDAAREAEINAMEKFCKTWDIDFDLVRARHWPTSSSARTPSSTTPTTPKAKEKKTISTPTPTQDKPLSEKPVKKVDGKIVVDWE